MQRHFLRYVGQNYAVYTSFSGGAAFDITRVLICHDFQSCAVADFSLYP